jgi:hypothetical protein
MLRRRPPHLTGPRRRRSRRMLLPWAALRLRLRRPRGRLPRTRSRRKRRQWLHRSMPNRRRASFPSVDMEWWSMRSAGLEFPRLSVSPFVARSNRREPPAWPYRSWAAALPGSRFPRPERWCRSAPRSWSASPASHACKFGFVPCTSNERSGAPSFARFLAKGGIRRTPLKAVSSRRQSSGE